MSEQEARDIQDAKDVISEKKQVRRDRNAMKERWSYVILAVIIIFLFIGFSVAGINYVKTNDQAWCELVHASIPPKAPALPEDPKAHPDLVKRYNDYQIIVRLGHRLGCL